MIIMSAIGLSPDRCQHSTIRRPTQRYSAFAASDTTRPPSRPRSPAWHAHRKKRASAAHVPSATVTKRRRLNELKAPPAKSRATGRERSMYLRRLSCLPLVSPPDRCQHSTIRRPMQLCYLETNASQGWASGGCKVMFLAESSALARGRGSFQQHQTPPGLHHVRETALEAPD